MKILLAVSMIFFASLSGCKSDKYIKIDSDTTKTNAPAQTTGFNKENYVWEGFQFTTNRVDR